MAPKDNNMTGSCLRQFSHGQRRFRNATVWMSDLVHTGAKRMIDQKMMWAKKFRSDKITKDAIGHIALGPIWDLF